MFDAHAASGTRGTSMRILAIRRNGIQSRFTDTFCVQNFLPSILLSITLAQLYYRSVKAGTSNHIVCGNINDGTFG